MMAAQLQQAGGAASSQSAGQTSALSGAVAASTEAVEPPPKVSKPLRNRTSESDSPYVRSQAKTLVNWQLLDNEALELAKSENKLIFLHVGFLACHYCHMTTRDSFSNPDIAAVLNESFIPIAVDREERPDIDSIYWNYLQLVNSSAGWPINAFLTPELEPVFGGTYWPGPGSEDSIHDGGDGEDFIGFLGILQKLRQSWSEKEAQCRSEAKETVAQLGKFAAEGTLGPRGLLRPDESSEAAHLSVDLDLDIDQLDEAYTQLKKTFDPVNGGFGVVPKFVTPAKYAFLLQLGSMPSVVQDIIGGNEVNNAVRMALYTLQKLHDSALNDHIGGGFARASHTINWTLPHFEKLIPDNGLLLSLYLDAWLYVRQHPEAMTTKDATKKMEQQFGDVVYSLANYLSTAPVHPVDGGFVSSEAADSYNRKGSQHTRDGAYYLWARREFDTVIVGPNTDNDLEARVAAGHWNVQQHGNVDQEDDPNDEFINQNVLYVVKEENELARSFGTTPEEVLRMLASARKKLAAHREKERVRPPIDEKATAFGNGIVIGALARTGATLKFGGYDVESGNKCIGIAKTAARFIQEKLWNAKEQELYRAYSQGHHESIKGFAEDYTFLIEGLLELYEATGEIEWLQWADELQKRQIELFYDRTDVTPSEKHSSSGGFYRTTEKEAFNILRLKDGMDTTLPATNGVAASNLFRLGAMLDDKEYKHLARETIHAFEVEMLQHSWLFPSLLTQVVTARLGGRQFVAAAPSTDDTFISSYFQQPRAGLRTLLYTKPESASDENLSWLQKRNPTLASLPSSEESLVLDGQGTWRKANTADLVEKVETN